MEPDGLEGTKGFGTWWLNRKVRRLIRAVEILEERVDNVNETLVTDIGDLEVNISSNSADLEVNRVSKYNGYYYHD